jgi:hypothetical protein
MNQYLGLEIPSQAQQVFEPECSREQYIQRALYQRDGIKLDAYCL